MNVAIGHGTLAIGIGGSRGGARAEAGEFADIPAMMRTARFVLLLRPSALGQLQERKELGQEPAGGVGLDLDTFTLGLAERAQSEFQVLRVVFDH